MDEPRKLPINAIIAVLMLLVLGLGFYITARVIDEGNESTRAQIDAINDKLSTTNQKLIEVQNTLLDMKRAAKAGAPAPQPTPPPAPAPAK